MDDVCSDWTLGKYNKNCKKRRLVSERRRWISLCLLTQHDSEAFPALLGFASLGTMAYAIVQMNNLLQNERKDSKSLENI